MTLHQQYKQTLLENLLLFFNKSQFEDKMMEEKIAIKKSKSLGISLIRIS